MNESDIMDIINSMNSNMSPELRKYIYIEWVGWLVLIVSIFSGVAILWKLRKKIRSNCDDIPMAEIAIVLGLIIGGLMMIAFIPYSAHVFITPELEAVRSIIGK